MERAGFEIHDVEGLRPHYALTLRRRALLVFVAAGVAVGAYLLYVMVAYPIVSRPTGQHIEYVSPHFFAAAVMTLYLLSTTFSPILSTHRMVKACEVMHTFLRADPDVIMVGELRDQETAGIAGHRTIRF